MNFPDLDCVQPFKNPEKFKMYANFGKVHLNKKYAVVLKYI